MVFICCVFIYGRLTGALLGMAVARLHALANPNTSNFEIFAKILTVS